MTEPGSADSNELSALLTTAGVQPLNSGQIASFEKYLELILKWNERMNLTAVRDRVGILGRHFLECIVLARALPSQIHSVLDLGSGAGFPGIPIAICQPHMAVTLAESQSKKAAFLNEVVRTLELQSRVFGGRAESINTVFDCVALRAVDRMAHAVKIAANLVAKPGWMAVLSTAGSQRDVIQSAGEEFSWDDPLKLPLSSERVVFLGSRAEHKPTFHVEH